MRKPCTWLVIALLGGVPLAGCGGSGSKSSGTNATSSQNGAAAGGGSSAEQGSSAGTSNSQKGSSAATTGAGTHPLTPTAAVEACKRAVHAPSTLSASTTAKLEKSCEKAGGGASARRQLLHEVCEALASAPRVPAAKRERALAICRRAP